MGFGSDNRRISVTASAESSRSRLLAGILGVLREAVSGIGTVGAFHRGYI